MVQLMQCSLPWMEMDEWREQLTEVVSEKLLAELAFRWQVTRRRKQG